MFTVYNDIADKKKYVSSFPKKHFKVLWFGKAVKFTQG